MLLAVDANELLAAIIARGKTLGLFFDGRLELVSPKFILDEFREHKHEVMEKTGLNESDVSSYLLLLSPKIRFFETGDFEEFLQEARRISPDPNDVEYFALALKLNCPIWSEDKELKRQSKVNVLSTGELIELIGP
jgi:predicted nucleic acid-binding protein